MSQEGHKSPGHRFSTVFPQPLLSAGCWLFSIHFSPAKTQAKVSIVKSYTPLPSPTSFPELSCMAEFTAFLCQDSTQECGGLDQEAKLHPKLLPGFNSSEEGTIFFCVSITTCTMGDLGLLCSASVQMINNNVPVEIQFLQMPFFMASLNVPLWLRLYLQVAGP